MAKLQKFPPDGELAWDKVAAVTALKNMDDLYPQRNGDTWAVRTQLVRQLADPRPYDLDSVDLAEYKGIQPPLNLWANVAEICAGLADRLTHVQPLDPERASAKALIGLKWAHSDFVVPRRKCLSL